MDETARLLRVGPDDRDAEFETVKILRGEREEKRADKQLARLDDEGINLAIEQMYLHGKNGKEIKEALGIDLTRLHDGLELIRAGWRAEAATSVLREKLMASSRAV